MTSPIRLILLPGMDGTGELFAPFTAALDETRPIQIMRYPADVPLDYAALEGLVRRALPMDAPYVLVGESFSGPLAVSIAASHPPGLRGVVLCCSFATPPRSVPAALQGLVRLVPFGLMPWGIAGRVLLGRFSRPDILALFEKALGGVSPAVLRTRMRATLTIDVSAKLNTVTVPMLYLQATEDRLVPPTAAQRIVALRPGTEVVKIEAPHFLLQCAPQQAVHHIQDFLEKL